MGCGNSAKVSDSDDGISPPPTRGPVKIEELETPGFKPNSLKRIFFNKSFTGEVEDETINDTSPNKKRDSSAKSLKRQGSAISRLRASAKLKVMRHLAM